LVGGRGPVFVAELGRDGAAVAPGLALHPAAAARLAAAAPAAAAG